MTGFGTDTAGVKAFAASGSLLGDLGTSYIGAWVGDLITIGAAVSAFGCALACSVGASRLAYALSRDGVGPARLAVVSERRGTPHFAAAAVVAAMYVIGYTLYRNVLPYPTGPAAWFPVWCAGSGCWPRSCSSSPGPASPAAPASG